MEETANTQRLLLAAVLCFGVLMSWNYLFPQKRPAVRKAPNVVATSTSTVEVRAGTSAEAAPRMEVEREELKFSGTTSDKTGTKLGYELALTNEGAAFDGFRLPTFFERDSKNAATDQNISLAEPVASLTDPRHQMGGISFGEGTTFNVPARAVYQVVERGESSVRYRYVTKERVVVEREYKLRADSFEVEMAVTLRNESAQPQRHRLHLNAGLRKRASMKGQWWFMPPPDHLNALCFREGRVEREGDGSASHQQSVKWVGIDRQYFLAALIQRDGVSADCKIEGGEAGAVASLILPEVSLMPGEERRHKFTAYLGVKKPDLLSRSEAQLEAAIDYTVMGLNLALLCEGLLALLALLHRLSGSWGVAILGLTVIVKLVLFPLNQRSGRSMRAMSTLKPQIDALKEKFPEDRQRQSEELMRLYKDNGVNPASGCVPILLQMPIWFALYRALWVSVDLYQQPFLWIPDLTASDPIWVLPVLLVLVMFVQQKMTPTTMDPVQQKVMLYFMPLMFGSMMAALPAGLAFYILVNSVLTIAQQHLINRTVGPKVGPPSATTATA